MAGYIKPLSIIHGQRYGRLVAVERVANAGAATCWKMICDCGNEIVARTNNLRKGSTKSCGCLRASHVKLAWEARRTHGMSNTPEYHSWSKMLDRCLNKNSDARKYYGGRGITVCERWLRFENFFADMGSRPHGRTLDRIDNDGNYEPLNCKWSTPKEQANNKRAYGTSDERLMKGKTLA